MASAPVASAKYVSPPIPLPSPETLADAARGIIEVSGVDMSGPSFEVRLFLNNPAAGPETPRTPENGYAGAFHVYGYGFPAGAVSEPARPSSVGAPRRPLPTTRSVEATEAIRRAAAQGTTASVTVVPVAYRPAEQEALDREPVLNIERIRIDVEPG